MGTTPSPASGAEALGMLESAVGFLADADWAQMPAQVIAGCLRSLEQADAVEAAARARMFQAFDAKDGHLADGQRTTRAWLVHSLRVTRGQAGLYGAVQALAGEHRPLLAGLRDRAVTTSVALQLAKWTRVIPAEHRPQAEDILIAAARAGADLRALAAICAEMRRLGFCIMIGVPGTRSSALRAGCRAQMPRCVLVLSSVPSPMSARLRADARGAGRDDNPDDH